MNASAPGSAPAPRSETSHATIRDVARVAGVSLGSISNYLSGKAAISESHRARIESAIEQLNYIPNTAVRVMRGARNPVLGFIIPDAGNPYFTEVARGIEDVAIAAGWVVVTCNTNGEPSREDHYADALSQMRVVGAIVTHQSASAQHLAQLHASGAAVVLLGSSGDEPFPSVTVDDERGGYLAARHLLELGRRDIAFVGGPGGEAEIAARIRGATLALAEFGVDRPLMRVDAAGNSLAQRMQAGEQLLNLSPRPAAVFCANDLIALAVQSSIVNSGLRVPEDVAVIGYDDIDGAALGLRPISTIRQPQYELGVAAAQLIVDFTRGTDVSAESVRFTPELIVRSSTVFDS